MLPRDTILPALRKLYRLTWKRLRGLRGVENGDHVQVDKSGVYVFKSHGGRGADVCSGNFEYGLDRMHEKGRTF